MRSTDWSELSDIVRYALSGSASENGEAQSSCPNSKEVLEGPGPFVTLEGRLWQPDHARCQRCAEDNTVQGDRIFVAYNDEVSSPIIPQTRINSFEFRYEN